MRIYLSAGFGSPLGDDLRLIRSLGFSGVRQDLPPGKEHGLIWEFSRFGPGAALRPLFLVNGGHMEEPPQQAGERAAQVALLMHELGIAGEIEIGNEPNIRTACEPYRSTPGATALSVRVAWDIMQRDPRLRGTRLVVGGIMTTDASGLRYLQEVVSVLPGSVIVGFHTYRSTSRPDQPHKGFSSRGAEFHRLQAIAGGRELWNTEVGWHTWPSKVGCWPMKKTVRWTDEQVYRFLVKEAHLNAAAGVKVMTVYQWNDGPNDHFDDRFGIRRVDGSLKPSAHIGRWA